MVACNAWVSGCLRLASGKWSPVFPSVVRSCSILCGPVLCCPAQCCPVLSRSLQVCRVLCFFKDVIFEFLQFLLLLVPSFPVVPLSVCLPSVFVFPFYTGYGSNFHFCPRPCFEHLSTVQTCTPKQRTTHCAFRALAPALPLFPPHVSHRLGSLQKLAQAVQRYGQLRDKQLHRGAIRALRGNRRSQRPSVPPLAFSESLLLLHPFVGGVQTVSQLFPGCVPFPCCCPAC